MFRLWLKSSEPADAGAVVSRQVGIRVPWSGLRNRTQNAACGHAAYKMSWGWPRKAGSHEATKADDRHHSPEAKNPL